MSISPETTSGRCWWQGAATGDVEQLHAAADREDRQPLRVGGPGQGELELVQVALHRPSRGIEVPTVAAGIEVRPPRQTDAVDPLEQSKRQLGPERRDNERDRAGRLQRLEVLEAQRHLMRRRLTLGRGRHGLRPPDLGGGNGDERPVGGRVRLCRRFAGHNAQAQSRRRPNIPMRAVSSWRSTI